MSKETAEQFITARQGAWARLEALAGRAGRGRIADLAPPEIEELGRLYRQATADLAYARRDYPQDRLTIYLNRLVAQTYPVIYRSEGWTWRRIVDFYARDFPRLVRKQWVYVALAAALLFIPAVAAWVAVVAQPGNAAALLPSQVYDQVQSTLERHDLWTHIPIDKRPYTGTAIMTNNIQVSFFAFVGGLTCGVLTALVLVFNGISLGAVAGLVQVYGLSLDLWAFIFPHGFIELTVICLAGGAGLRMAGAILRPGLPARTAQLRVAALEAVQMLLGGAGLLIIAGTIEGNISPSDTPPLFRLGFGLLTGILLYSYLIFAGRPRAGQPPAG